MNDAQWKILGIAVCSIMLITIIVTLIIFIFCYKNGYMFNQDEDENPLDSSDTKDADGNSRQKAVLRKIYKFNRPNDSSITPAGMVVNTMTPSVAQTQTVLVTDKQTNTEATISTTRPRDFHLGVWNSINAYGGKSYRPLIAPKMVSRIIQVLPHEIEAAFQPTKVVYQVIAPTIAVSPLPEQTRYIKIPAPQAPLIEVIEQPRKPIKTQIIHQAPVQRVMAAPPSQTRIEYVEVEEPRNRRLVQKPQYEIVEEVIDGDTSSGSDEYVEVVDTSRHASRRQPKKSKKQGVGQISVKHVKK